MAQPICIKELEEARETWNLCWHFNEKREHCKTKKREKVNGLAEKNKHSGKVRDPIMETSQVLTTEGKPTNKVR